MLHFSIVSNKSRNISTSRAVAPQRRPATERRPPLSARSIALSVLLGTHPPELPARAVVALAELFDIPGGTMRTALSRLVSAGDVLAAAGRYRLAGPLLERQKAQDAGRRPPRAGWDGGWHTIVAAADQRDLADRRRFRATMANHRFGELRPDIWMRPANLERPPVEANWIATTGDLDGIVPERLIGRLWDLDEIAAQANGLLHEMHTMRGRVDWDDVASIPELFTTSAAVVRFLRNEPLLPTALTPASWPVDEVRTAYDAFEADHQRLLTAFLRHA
jgi:phenylacetic acid degradation operon negative regulatory protein